MKRILLSMAAVLFINMLPLNAQSFQHQVYSENTVISSKQYVKGNIYQKDLLLFVDMLKTSHPIFALGTSSTINIDSIGKQGYLWAEKCNSVDELSYYLQSIASLLNDGHTSILPDLDKNAIYPFSFIIVGEHVFLNVIDKNYESYLGKEITKINNHPVKEVIESFRSQISSDNDVYFKDNVNGYMQFLNLWKHNSYSMNDKSLVLSFEDEKDIKLYPVNKQNMNITYLQTSFQEGLVTIRNKQPFSYNLLEDESICYFQFNQCTDNSDIRYQLNMQNKEITEAMEAKLALIPRFDTVVANMFKEMKEHRIKTLVVDVRNNGGGNSRLCDILLSYLKPKEETQTMPSQIRISNLWKAQYPLLFSEFTEGLEKRNQKLEIGKLYNAYDLSFGEDSQSPDMSISLFEINTDKEKIFKGKVFFIQSPKTFSSAGMLITMAADNNIGKVIGSESSYRPCHYGDLLAWELPNTKTRGFVSHKIFKRPNSTKCNESSIVPEVKIETSLEDMQSGDDRAWDWILDNYSM